MQYRIRDWGILIWQCHFQCSQILGFQLLLDDFKSSISNLLKTGKGQQKKNQKEKVN